MSSTGRVLIAPERADLQGPVIFLAGPTQGPASWHPDAMRILRSLDPEVHLASPKRPLNPDKDFSTDMYNEQVDWETHFLRRAGREGVVLFWLAREKQEEHRCDRAYAQTTRFELGEWKERHARDGVPMVVGIEEGFTGGRYVRRRFSQDCPGVKICDSLEETCRAAIELARAGRAPRGQSSP